MGAKAVMLAPYSSQILLDNIIKNVEIPNELNYNRFIN